MHVLIIHNYTKKLQEEIQMAFSHLVFDEFKSYIGNVNMLKEINKMLRKSIFYYKRTQQNIVFIL